MACWAAWESRCSAWALAPLSWEPALRGQPPRPSLYVRTAARSSIRKRKRVSEPDKPPSGHSGDLRRGIYFSYDPQRDSVVIGPVPLHGRNYRDAMQALEYGGTVTRYRRDWSKGRDARGRGIMKAYRATYKARPFMRPAFEQEQPKLPAMWQDSIR